MHKHGQACAGAHEDGLIAHLEQLVDGQNTADDHIGHDLYTLGLQILHLVGNDGLGESELGNAVNQHAACGVQGLENGDLVALLGQIAGAGQAGRAGTDNGHLHAVGGGLLGLGVHVLPVPVGNKALQTADGHRLALNTPDALALALALLGADTAGQSGQGIGGGDDLVGSLEIALGYLMNKLGDAHIDRAALDALGVLAVQAAACLFLGHLFGIAQGNLFEIAGTNLGVLLRHRGLGQSHICHFLFLPYLISALPMASIRQTWSLATSASRSR